MKVNRELHIVFDSDKPILIGAESVGSPWEDMMICMEAVGCLAALVRRSGITEHKGLSLRNYLHEYLDRVLEDYDKSYTTGPKLN